MKLVKVVNQDREHHAHADSSFSQPDYIRGAIGVTSLFQSKR